MSSKNLTDALERVVKAWESLPGNTHYSPLEIERWLRTRMAPAIDNARRALVDQARAVQAAAAQVAREALSARPRVGAGGAMRARRRKA